MTYLLLICHRISQLTETHKQCYVLASAPLHGKQEQELLTTLQKQFVINSRPLAICAPNGLKQ